MALSSSKKKRRRSNSSNFNNFNASAMTSTPPLQQLLDTTPTERTTSTRGNNNMNHRSAVIASSKPLLLWMFLLLTVFTMMERGILTVEGFSVVGSQWKLQVSHHQSSSIRIPFASSQNGHYPDPKFSHDSSRKLKLSASSELYSTPRRRRRRSGRSQGDYFYGEMMEEDFDRNGYAYDDGYDERDNEEDDYYNLEETDVSRDAADNQSSDDDDDDDDDDYFSSMYVNEKKPKKRSSSSSRNGINLNGDYDEEAEDNTYYYDDGEKNEEDDDDDDNSWTRRRGGMYKVYFDPLDQEDAATETQIDWEPVDADDDNGSDINAMVVLPPPSVETPTAILHFVGGTIFGSAPRQWYRTLLEGIVQNTNCAIVVTPIPITVRQNPLQHVKLCKKLQKSFQSAYELVLEDEYGPIVLQEVPVCGLGHSLGARLLVVLETLQLSSPSYKPYKSLILLSFTNFPASAGIPGLQALLQQSRRQKRKQQQRGRGSSNRRSGRSNYDSYYDDDVDEDFDEDLLELQEEWGELIGDLKGLIQEQADKVRTALTPNSKELEFFPTPDMLWKAIPERYTVRNTLTVQFDDDAMDQSSKLAEMIHLMHQDEKTPETKDEDENESSDTATATRKSIHFCRLRGTHLSPISVPSPKQNPREGNNGWLSDIAGASSKTIAKVIQGQQSETTMRDLIQSVSRYVTDVVTTK